MHSTVAKTTTTSSPFDEAAELAKISASCMSFSDFEELSGGVVKYIVARHLAPELAIETIESIGLAELRASLNFAPLSPWTHYNETRPSEEELASAPTLEAYYNLKEPKSSTSSLDSDHLYEKNVHDAVAYFDRRFPAVRIIYRRRFEEFRRSYPGEIDRKTIDRMIAEFIEIGGRVHRIGNIFHPSIYAAKKCRKD